MTQIKDLDLLREGHTVIYTDGGCDPNPGTGGWGVLIRTLDNAQDSSEEIKDIELSGFELNTTNNRMEMMAVLKALEYAQAHHLNKLVLYSDSQIVVYGITGVWRRKSNLDIWALIMPLYNLIKPQVLWVKGHSGIEGNERADQLAMQALVLNKPKEKHTKAKQQGTSLLNKIAFNKTEVIKTEINKMDSEPENINNSGLNNSESLLRCCPPDWYAACGNAPLSCKSCSAGTGSLTGLLRFVLNKNLNLNKLEERRLIKKNHPVHTLIKNQRAAQPAPEINKTLSKQVKSGLKAERTLARTVNNSLKQNLIKQTLRSGAVNGDGDLKLKDLLQIDSKVRHKTRSFHVSWDEYVKGRAQGTNTWAIQVTDEQGKSHTLMCLTLETFNQLLALALENKHDES